MNNAEIIGNCLQTCADWGLIPTSFKQCMTWEEQVLWLARFLQETVIPTVNANTNAFNDLKTYVENYFDNLDVQEEINNKLDAMAESGELAELIASYLNTRAMFVFDTVAALKAAENLVDGSYARTLGYYAAGDGGEGVYKISDTSSVTAKQETLDSGLYAQLVTTKIVNPGAFGCYGDGTHDDTAALQAAINYATTNNLDIEGNATYLLSDTITFTSTSAKKITLAHVKTSNLGNKALFKFDHSRYDTIKIGTITGEKIDVPAISNSYTHQTAFLLHGTSYEHIEVEKIENFVCGFLLYSTGGSGAEGSYYNDICCKKCDTFYFAHFLGYNGCINGNTFHDSLHFVTSWTNTGNYDQYMLINESTGTAPVYVNNHNVFTGMMAEKVVSDDGVTYYIADLSDCNSTQIEIDRIEIQPSFDLTAIATFNAQSSYNMIKFNTGWMTIPYTKAITGNNNYIVGFNNYKNAMIGQKAFDASPVTINANFEAIKNDICDGHSVYFPATGTARISGLFKTLTALTANTNYQFCTFTKPTAGAISTGIVYSVNSFNPTVLTPIGTIRQVKDQWYSYLRLSTDIAENGGFYVDYTLE